MVTVGPWGSRAAGAGAGGGNLTAAGPRDCPEIAAGERPERPRPFTWWFSFISLSPPRGERAGGVTPISQVGRVRPLQPPARRGFSAGCFPEAGPSVSASWIRVCARLSGTVHWGCREAELGALRVYLSFVFNSPVSRGRFGNVNFKCKFFTFYFLKVLFSPEPWRLQNH